MNAGTPAARSPSAALCAVGTAGSVYGVLDIVYVFVVFGWRDGRAARILQGIAVRVLGPAASSAAEVTPPGVHGLPGRDLHQDGLVARVALASRRALRPSSPERLSTGRFFETHERRTGSPGQDTERV